MQSQAARKSSTQVTLYQQVLDCRGLFIDVCQRCLQFVPISLSGFLFSWKLPCLLLTQSIDTAVPTHEEQQQQNSDELNERGEVCVGRAALEQLWGYPFVC